MAKNKIYTDKYSASSLEGSNRAAMSVTLCEKVIGLMYSAKESLGNGDYEERNKTLSKIPEEIGSLISIVDVAALGEFGQQMSTFYLKLSVNIYGIILNDLKSDILDDLLKKMLEARDTWKQLDARYVNETQHSMPPETGGLL